MGERLRPYKQYYDAVYRFEDHGAILVTLFVFETVGHASSFASLCVSGRNVARTSRGGRCPSMSLRLRPFARRGCGRRSGSLLEVSFRGGM